jgi:hypothetical protein
MEGIPGGKEKPVLIRGIFYIKKSPADRAGDFLKKPGASSITRAQVGKPTFHAAFQTCR